MRRLMINSTLENTERAGDHRKSNQRHETVSIKVRTVITRTHTAAGEGVEANASKSQSLSRVSTWGFSGSHVVKIGDLQTADFTGMDSSAVISTWGLSRPSVDFLATYLDIHRVSSADVINLIPTDSDLSQGIGNHDSLVEEGHLGSDKGHMEKVRDHQAPTQSDCNSFETLTKEALHNEAKTEQVDEAGKEVATSRTVHLRITHTSSLSRKVLR